MQRRVFPPTRRTFSPLLGGYDCWVLVIGRFGCHECIFQPIGGGSSGFTTIVSLIPTVDMNVGNLPLPNRGKACHGVSGLINVSGIIIHCPCDNIIASPLSSSRAGMPAERAAATASGPSFASLTTPEHQPSRIVPSSRVAGFGSARTRSRNCRATCLPPSATSDSRRTRGDIHSQSRRRHAISRPDSSIQGDSTSSRH